MNNKKVLGNHCAYNENCPIGRALDIIGGKWKLRIICSLYLNGAQRFNELTYRIKGITNAMLSTSLKELESDGLIIRKQYEEIPVRVEYTLTKHGEELWPILHSLVQWSIGKEFSENDHIFKRDLDQNI